MSDSEEDMAVPEEAPVELVSTVTTDTLVVTVASSDEATDRKEGIGPPHQF